MGLCGVNSFWCPGVRALGLLLFVLALDVSTIAATDSPSAIDSLYQTDHVFSPEDADKRASSFLPMRGRREGFSDGVGDEKRASAFFPLRGKKDFYEDKRASAFLPMRGRRDFYREDVYGEEPEFLPDSEEEKRSRSFLPMRGRKDGIYVGGGEDDKRASAFLPMRGRKAGSSGPKRASAFLPMRGKKEKEREDEAGILDVDGHEDDDKRAFHAMRGRNVAYPFWSSEESEEESKRAFHALRGKKDYLDVAALKRAFHAMRGKKNFAKVDGFVSSLRHSADDSAAHPLEGNSSSSDGKGEEKRGSGFFGMRGKRNTFLDKGTWSESGQDSGLAL